MKIYTKKGDKGKTDLLHERITKSDLKMDVVGTIDEVISFISLSNALNENKEVKEVLIKVRKDLSNLAHEAVSLKKVYFNQTKIKEIEELIDLYDNKLPPLKEFIYFEDNLKSSIINVSRTITRRLERKLVKLNEKEKINEFILIYINRLSDLLFVISRYVEETS